MQEGGKQEELGGRDGVREARELTEERRRDGETRLEKLEGGVKR